MLELTTDHIATVIKDRTGKYQDKTIEKPGEDFGRELAAWLTDGKTPAQTEPPKAQAEDPKSQTTEQPKNESTKAEGPRPRYPQGGDPGGYRVFSGVRRFG